MLAWRARFSDTSMIFMTKSAPPHNLRGGATVYDSLPKIKSTEQPK